MAECNGTDKDIERASPIQVVKKTKVLFSQSECVWEWVHDEECYEIMNEKIIYIYRN